MAKIRYFSLHLSGLTVFVPLGAAVGREGGKRPQEGPTHLFVEMGRGYGIMKKRSMLMKRKITIGLIALAMAL
ncbi:MAG: hypothetical protein J5755_03485, partial [Clostridia bacterium]|nr:hypothetical protein [Clostridia bacterium]